jgi:demethylmenaquinone methyltransferase/2-methoxy-6-polyprenyl-1,4-benzoquinol methylase
LNGVREFDSSKTSLTLLLFIYDRGSFYMFNHFDHIASFYDRLLPSPDLAKWRDLLQLPTLGSLLDAGGGTGRVSYQLRRWAGQVVICDFSLPMLKRAKAKTGPHPVRADAEKLPFPDEAFDRVIVVDALHHFGHQERTLKELVRVLKKGGRIVIEEPDITRFAVKLSALFERLALMQSKFHSPTAIQRMLRAEGLSAKVKSAPLFSVWIFADK